MPSIEKVYSVDEQNILLTIAARSIENGLKYGSPLVVVTSSYPPILQQQRASFVTLEINKQLRGCIGMLQATRPLVEDIAENAYSAAFNDPRFAPLQEFEYKQLDIHLSILTTPEAMTVSSEHELLEKMQPGIDGIIISDGFRRATFLPSVWESLPQPIDFLHHLKQKAGFPIDYWSAEMSVERYETISFGKPVKEIIV